MAKRFFDHHPPPLSLSFGHEARSRKPRDYRAEEAVRDGEIEKVAACGAGGFIELGQMLAQPVVHPGIVEITLQIAHALGQPSPGILIKPADLVPAVLSDKLLHRIGEALAPLLCRLGGEIDTDEPKFVR